MSLCAPVSLRGQILSGWSATHEAHRPAHLSGTLRLPRVKNPLLLHTPFIRGAKEEENAPVGPGKGVGTSSWEREAVQGPPPLRLGARELLLSTKCPISHQSPTGLPHWLCLGWFSAFTRLGAGCQCLNSSLCRDHCPGGIPGLRFAREQRHQRGAFPFPSPHPGWQSLWYLSVGGEAEQAVRERSATQNSGEFGPIPRVLPGVNSGSCTSKHICVTTHNEPVVYVQRHPSCFSAGAQLQDYSLQLTLVMLFYLI